MNQYKYLKYKLKYKSRKAGSQKILPITISSDESRFLKDINQELISISESDNILGHCNHILNLTRNYYNYHGYEDIIDNDAFFFGLLEDIMLKSLMILDNKNQKKIFCLAYNKINKLYHSDKYKECRPLFEDSDFSANKSFLHLGGMKKNTLVEIENPEMDLKHISIIKKSMQKLYHEHCYLDGI